MFDSEFAAKVVNNRKIAIFAAPFDIIITALAAPGSVQATNPSKAMRHYELTFIVDPVLSNEETQAIRQTYEEQVKKNGATIVHVDDMGLRQLAYPLNKRNSGIYYSIEFSAETGEAIAPLELALRRDERIMRYLTIALDKFAVKYNEDKRNGLIKKTQRMKRKSGKHGDNSTPVPTVPPPVKVIEPVAVAADVVTEEE
jgi:small subunit ribosomal protein S6